MTGKSILVLGNLSIATLDIHAKEFGWYVRRANSLTQLREMGACRNVTCVLFDATALGLSPRDALKGVLEAAPHVFPVICYRFSDMIDWHELAAAGAFHALLLPARGLEVRQSLGFVWDAERRRPAPLASLRAANAA